MGKKKKNQFIKKKEAHKFSLVHRSQRDPLQADEEAAQHVLKPITDQHSEISDTKEEKIEHGIYFDDDYDYMQHLRPRGEGMLVYADESLNEKDRNTEKVPYGNVKLPSEVFASNEEEHIGMLNKGVLPKGPQPEWDPDIVAALDDGVDFDDPDNFLDDNFIAFANAAENAGEYSRDIGSHNYADGNDEEFDTDSEASDISSNNFFSDEDIDGFAKEETKSRFTEYSMTSSVIRRTEGLKVLDDRFERIMEEYDEEEIGCIDHEEVQGALSANNDLINSVVDGFLDSTKTHTLEEVKGDDADENEKIIEAEESSDTEDEEKIFAQFKTEPKEKWDCESILSTYSNIYNHPKLITEERKPQTYKLHKHTGIPIGVLGDKKKGRDINDSVAEDWEMSETVLVNNVRNKSETAEERRLRKQGVKDQRKNRRMEKKSNKLAFKTEFQKQEKITNNSSLQKGLKL